MIDATPLPSVTAAPAEEALTVKLTVAPTTAAPPVVRVSVAERLTGPEEPNWTEAGLGAAKVSVVATFAGPLNATVIVCAVLFIVNLHVALPLVHPEFIV